MEEIISALNAEQFEQLITVLNEQKDLLIFLNNTVSYVSQFIIIVCITIFVWFVFKLLYSLFGHVFFGGI